MILKTDSIFNIKEIKFKKNIFLMINLNIFFIFKIINDNEIFEDLFNIDIELLEIDKIK